MLELFTDIAGLIGSWANAIFWIVMILVGFAALAGVANMFRPKTDEDSKIRHMEGLDTLSKKTCVVRSVAHDNRNGNRAANAANAKPTVVIRFKGDPMAKQRNDLALLVNEVLYNKDKIEGAVVVVESPGGAVPHYGMAFAELERIRNAGIPLEVCIDIFGASGGYLMSLPANRIIAAPFAYVGSIGVVAQMLNFYDLLKKVGINPIIKTAGEFKRTITPMGEVTPEAEEHFQGQLDRIHAAFGALVAKYRPDAEIDRVTTGEHWTAQESIDNNLGLVDEIATSTDYLFRMNKERDLVTLFVKQDPKNKLMQLMSMTIDLVMDKVAARLSSNGIH